MNTNPDLNPAETELAIYDKAKYWIAQYESVDEVKDFRDKAKACQAYANQAKNYDLELQAARARVRAERRCGELLKEMDKAKGVLKQGDKLPQSNGTTTGPTLSDMGLTKDQSSKWQQLANVPEDEFERELNSGGTVPSLNGILKSQKSINEERIDEDALYFWGRLTAIEKRLLKNRSMEELVDEMTPAMREDAERIIPALRRWIGD